MYHLFALTIALSCLLPISSTYAQTTSDHVFRALVLTVTNERTETLEDMDGLTRQMQTVRLRGTEGAQKGTEFTIENSILNNRDDMRLHPGEKVVVEKIVKTNGETVYQVREKYRLGNIGILVGIFVILAILLGGIMGFTSLLGLIVSIGILAFFVVPQIASGSPPLLISLVGSFAIAITSLYLAHGFTWRTSVALLSTLLTLAISVALAVIFVSVAKLFGTGSEEAVYLQLGQESVNLQGLLLGGIVIGCLGVLDDITTAQTAAIDEIRKANPSLSFPELYRSGMSVGREHIASLINTLALAYAGASLPLLLLFRMQSDYPVWFTLNSEFLAEEIVRTLVGSTTLLFAVPISTYFAAVLLSKLPQSKGSSGHSHAHHARHL